MSKYNQTKFYWLQLKEDFFEDDAIQWLEEQQPKGKEYALFYLKLCLKSLKSNGVLIRNVGNILVPYDNKKLAELTKTDFDTVVIAMELLKTIGLIQILENGEIYIQQLEELIGSKSIGAFKKQQQRMMGGQMSAKCPPKIEIEKEIEKEIKIEKETEIDIINNNGQKDGCQMITKQLINNNTDKSIMELEKNIIEDNVEDNVRQENRDKSIDNRDIDNKDKNNKLILSNDDKKINSKQFEKEFENIWLYYPNKKGKDQAKNKYISARKDGTTYEEVVQGLKNYINYIKTEKVEPKYIKHGSTWFNQKCWKDEYKLSNTSNKKVDEQMEFLKGVYNGTIKVN